ncbi:hypothetical protein HMPREF9013_0151 [Bulleidia extructa W1219]|uniref:Uncharacterized protein n=1 Tax=Bulleidia extructa W1219 TaxID=679192 RepID=D2MNC7_9FIRM|nr:hypothetical protein HMPREF9013_0151 [Bulleidia extructa W1219]
MERVPLSYACYSTYPLISTTTEIHFLPKIAKKNASIYITATFIL